jgi:hypothetical protein
MSEVMVCPFSSDEADLIGWSASVNAGRLKCALQRIRKLRFAVTSETLVLKFRVLDLSSRHCDDFYLILKAWVRVGLLASAESILTLDARFGFARDNLTRKNINADHRGKNHG